jgi:hypothetical protein
LLAIAAASVAWAHHATSNFDMAKNYIFKGTVRKWLWENPHAWLYIEVSKADGSTELWGVEAGGPNTLSRAGLHANTLMPGDKVTVYASPDKKGIHNASLRKVVLADGREFSYLGAPPSGARRGAGPGGPNGPAGPVGPQVGEGLPELPSAPAVEYK